MPDKLQITSRWNKKFKKIYDLGVDEEPEGVSIDRTGDVYVSYDDFHHHIFFEKFSTDFWGKYTYNRYPDDYPFCHISSNNKGSAKKGTSNSTIATDATQDAEPTEKFGGIGDGEPGEAANGEAGEDVPQDDDAGSIPAQNNTLSTIFFGDIEDDGEGCGVFIVLNFILGILTFGVAIAALIGITIFGIIYITAKGNEAQTIKAKRRIVDIVIGLALYAALWAILNFLLPGGSLNNSGQCQKTSYDQTTNVI